MQETFLFYIALILIILLLVMLAQKFKLAYPIILVLGGLGLSIIPGIPDVTIDPELIFLIFLPPLLYEAALYTSWKSLWRWRRVVSSFAFLIVIVTSFVVAIVSSSLLPGFTMALGFLLGGIVSPPDAVSASSVMKNVKVPKSLTAIIEGESLLNDASSLIVFRFALIAVDTGQFIFHKAALSFLVVIVMGIGTGIIIGLLYYLIHKWFPTDANTDIALTLTAPYVMYIAAEFFHFSGVLAVVSGGLFLSVRSHRFLGHRSRLRGANVWSTLGFVLNGLVFMLIGLALPAIIRQLGPVGLSTAIGYGAIITAVLIATRVVSTLGASLFTRFISRFITTADPNPGWRGPFIFGWAGMRGVVSLAAALSIPLHLSNGEPFPARNLILFITFTVILQTLVVQGLTLPIVIRWAKVPDHDHYLSPAEQDLQIRQQLAERSLHALEHQHGEKLKHNRALQQLRVKLRGEQSSEDEVIRSEQKTFKHVYLSILEEKRTLLHDLNRRNETDEEVIRKHLDLLDLEEEKIRMQFE